MKVLAAVLDSLREERERTAQQLEKLDVAIAALGGVVGNGVRGPRKKRTMSASARRRIAAAQRVRWPKVRGSNGAGGARRMSAAARRKIAAAQRARWAKWKAKQKKAA